MATVKGLLGRKIGMTRIFIDENNAGSEALKKQIGNSIPVTVIECGPCAVVQRKTAETDGYDALQIGYQERKTPRKDTKVARGESGRRGRGEANKPARGHFEKNGGAVPTRHLAEFRLDAEGDEPTAGSSLTVDALFKAGDAIKIQGKSKGRGFAGAMKRHGFSGQGASHGAKIHRKPASAGATDPARVFPGTRGPGRMGAANVTQKGLTVIEVDANRNLLIVKGAVPGAPGGILRIEQAN